MPVLMMHVRHVRMFVAQPLMPMRMCVRLTGRIIWPVSMLVVRVMNMRMEVLHRFMPMLVFVTLGKM